MIYIYEVLWLYLIPGLIFHWYSIIKNYKDIVNINKVGIIEKFNDKIIFLIATKDCINIVKDNVEYIHQSCKITNLKNYEIIITTQMDESCKINGATMIHVPKNFICKSKFKAKDLTYALEKLPNSKNVWIYHLDEDSRVIPQTICALTDYINRGGKPISNGLSVFIKNGSIVTFFAEAHRMWNFFWLKQQMKTTPMWLNGSNLLIRSDIEHEIGWNQGNSFSEDTSFGYAAIKQKGEIFGWHGGITIEHPAKNMSALYKQRKRWFYGGIAYFSQCPTKLKFKKIYAITSWLCGFILTVFYFFGMIGLYQVLPIFLTLFFITMITWYGRYQVGLYYNFKYNNLNTSKIKRLAYHLCLLIFTPVVELVCTFPTVLALIDPPIGFEMTEK